MKPRASAQIAGCGGKAQSTAAQIKSCQWLNRAGTGNRPENYAGALCPKPFLTRQVPARLANNSTGRARGRIPAANLNKEKGNQERQARWGQPKKCGACQVPVS